MTVFQIIALSATGICIVAMLWHFVRMLKLGAPNDLSEKSGSIARGVVYANTQAMLPNQKESAYLHLPTYSMGIIFHIGIFAGLLVYILSFFPFFNNWLSEIHWPGLVLGLCFLISATCGLSLFVKRLIDKNLMSLSNADDFLSNGLTTLFQYATALSLLFPVNGMLDTLYYIVVALLFLYMPLGKLKHLLYYFAARYHLGFFYGRRNVWPPTKG
ncbi:hypothetical protein LJC53_03650 [Bacteroidales bacterium OttesenSCG-928-C03]|nr:hypothetical protein [Bacteroidales bacterium OttesenSCG-928-C03]MDL2325934.1 hypothetical protein [Bacteroidales bacterium OttesenSCG-928-A14]